MIKLKRSKMSQEQREAIKKGRESLNLLQPLKITRQEAHDDIVSAETKSQFTDPVQPPSGRSHQRVVPVAA